MKTVITSSGDEVTAQFDKRFGRTGWFCLIEEGTEDVNFYFNNLKDVSNGAGIKAAEKMVELNVQKVISGDFGPKARDLLNTFNIQMVMLSEDNLTIGDIINRLNNKNNRR
ncbi:NifB/NifX family molybdenum-iron cluster-binding protein [Saccharicrinis sp. FJH62]|uniref:NifB/NifX family molybdenum-iron cluster-binding protein n=1 Tax=Saccharicrinis sp. FJH62 TaxID=3344657 RepID=UPI0035D4CE7E